MSDKIKKYRADLLLVEKDICSNAAEAKKLILAGKVRIGSDRVIKNASEMLPADITFNMQQTNQYVSRGAYKLLPAIEKYLPSLKGLIALDIGASTGGFTDLMLQYGIEKVYAVDAGTGQLHYKLRKDSRVISMEKTNARYFNANSLPEKVNLLVMDVSFISVKRILPALRKLFFKNSYGFILVKPQFELPSRLVEAGGVVRSEKSRQECVKSVIDFIAEEMKWQVIDIIDSPIKGPKGNQEYILCVKIK